MASEWLGKRRDTLRELGWGRAFLMGLAQGLAIAPGLSRSGTTIATGLFCGLKRDDAARFSFLMGIPVIAGAAGLRAVKMASTITSAEILYLALGFLAALAMGYVAIRFFLSYLRTHGMQPFAYYCWAIGIITLVVSFLR